MTALATRCWPAAATTFAWAWTTPAWAEARAALAWSNRFWAEVSSSPETAPDAARFWRRVRSVRARLKSAWALSTVALARVTSAARAAVLAAWASLVAK